MEFFRYFFWYRFFTREEPKQTSVDEELDQSVDEGFRSGIAALKELENRHLERHDSGVGDSMSSSVEEYDTACSQDDTPPSEPSVKKRLSFDNEDDDDVTERLPKRLRCIENDDLSSSEEFVNTDSEQLDSADSEHHPQFKTSADFITTRSDIVAQSDCDNVVDLTSAQEASSTSYQHYSVFNPRPLQAVSIKPTSLDRMKSTNSNIRIGKS